MKSTRSGWSSSSPAEDAGAVVGAEPAAQGASQPRSFLAELPVLVLIAFVLALVLKTFLVQAFYIPSQSMEPTLQVNDRVLVNKVVYRLREPHRGEVIVFANPDVMAEEQGNVVERVLRDLGSGLGMSQPFEKDFIKRIIGLPGETVEMRDGVVLVDGRPLPEATVAEGGYLAERDPANFGPIDVPEGEYFVMGDNRRNSSDSRFGLGTIRREDIVGRAFVTIWSPSRLGTLPASGYGPTDTDAAAPQWRPAA